VAVFCGSSLHGENRVNSYQLRLEKLPTHDEIHHQEQPSFLQADQETTMAWEKNGENSAPKRRKSRFLESTYVGFI
jgi:hypothetical protein